MERLPRLLPARRARGHQGLPQLPGVQPRAHPRGRTGLHPQRPRLRDRPARQLTPIAPTYTYDGFDGGDWREKFLAIAQDLGREEQARERLDAYYERAEETKAALEEKGVSPVVADIGYWEGQVYVSCYSISCLIFADLGLEITPLADTDGDGEPDRGDNPLSDEQLSQLADIDMFFTAINEDGSGLITEEESLKANPLWTSLPAIVNGQVYTYDLEMAQGSPSGQDALLEVVREALLG
ncbi:ABC transporter substrate-binding protein [Salana multivorans]